VCWSFAGLSCAETSFIMKGLADRKLDLSERHLNWFTFGADCDVSDPLYGGCANLGTGAYNKGGNSGNVTSVLARGCGPVEEELFPYSYTEPIDEMYRYMSLGRLNETAQFSPSDISGIKGAVMEYGSLFCGMNYITSMSKYGADYLNDDTWGYYCPVAATADTDAAHAVTIVGWDDDFSRYNFSDTPEGDGAWIIKNSHGTGSGDKGFFYLSYYDKTYGVPGIHKIVAFDMAPSDDYSKVYQYDAERYSAAKYGVSSAGANIFTAQRDESIEAVSFYTTDADIDHIIQVYRGVSGTSPVSGTLVFSQEGSSPYAGYHTAELDVPVFVEEGESFSVVVILSTNSAGKSYVSHDKYAPREGQSFYTSYKNGKFGTWKDMKTEHGGNVCIKAFTNAAAESGIGITVQPGDTEVIEGLDALLTVKAVGEGLSYSWQRLTDGGWTDMDGEVSSVLILRNVRCDMDGKSFRCVVRCPGGSVTSDTAEVRVKTAEEVNASQIADMSVSEGVSFVNAFTERYDKEGKDTVVLTEAQLLAVEKVLAHDMGG
ncbi:MAG: lectin like domain-containing protein, partial [Huintestinicola sp.]